MLSETQACIDESFADVPATDWRRQAARDFGEDAIAPMVKQFLALLQTIYAASCLEDEKRSMSVQFLGLEEDRFTPQISELFAAFAAEQLGAPVCLMSFDSSNRINIVNYGSFTERHPLRGTTAATVKDQSNVDLAATSESSFKASAMSAPSQDGQSFQLAKVELDPAERLNNHIERERSQAALLIVNTRPLDRSFESLMISRKVDGVIMVVDADNTEAASAMAARDKVNAVGGQFLGVVLKKAEKSEQSLLEESHRIWSSLERLVWQDWLRTGAIALSLCVIAACLVLVTIIADAQVIEMAAPTVAEKPSLANTPLDNNVEETKPFAQDGDRR